ncbi:MAG: lytic transglycosylase domain-containing protein [Bacilli bacterium]
MNTTSISRNTQPNIQYRNTIQESNTSFDTTLEKASARGSITPERSLPIIPLAALGIQNLPEMTTETTGAASTIETMHTYDKSSSLAMDGMPSTYDELILASSKKYGMDPRLIKSIMKHESNFDPNCVSHAGAAGLMQLMPITAEVSGVTDRFDVKQNIDGAVKYIRRMYDKHDGDLVLTLASYNAGPGNVAKYGGVPPFKETQNYIKKVTSTYERFLAQSE